MTFALIALQPYLDDSADGLYVVEQVGDVADQTMSRRLRYGRINPDHTYELADAAKALRTLVALDEHLWPPTTAVIGRVVDDRLESLTGVGLGDNGCAVTMEVALANGLQWEREP